MSVIFGYLVAALIGVSLGLLGGGGSILTVPMLVYLFHLPATEATAYSLFIVGVTALIGASLHARRGNLDFRSAVNFAIPMVLGVYLMRRFIGPSLPKTLFTLGSVSITKDRTTLVLFAILMLAAGVAMIRRPSVLPSGTPPEPLTFMLQGFITGLVTGAVGAGGGFLIVPALALAAQMPMKRAVATSLAVIATSSLMGFVGDLQAGQPIAWDLLSGIALVAVLGSLAGVWVSRWISGQRLKPAFGYLVFAMGLLVLISETVQTPGTSW